MQATSDTTDVYCIGLLVLAMVHAFIYLPRAAKSSRDNIRPMELMLSNISTFYVLTDELHDQNLQFLAAQKTKTNPFSS